MRRLREVRALLGDMVRDAVEDALANAHANIRECGEWAELDIAPDVERVASDALVIIVNDEMWEIKISRLRIR